MTGVQSSGGTRAPAKQNMARWAVTCAPSERVQMLQVQKDSRATEPYEIAGVPSRSSGCWAMSGAFLAQRAD